MKISYTKNFIKQSKKLSPSLRAKLIERIELFSSNPVAPQLQDHALTGQYSAYHSINISGDYKALYLLRENEAIFDLVGTHSQLYR